MTTTPQCGYSGKSGVNHRPRPCRVSSLWPVLRNFLSSPSERCLGACFPGRALLRPRPSWLDPAHFAVASGLGALDPCQAAGLSLQASGQSLRKRPQAAAAPGLSRALRHPCLLSVLRPGFQTHCAAQNQSKLM